MANVNFISTARILAALKTFLEQLKLPPGAVAPNCEPGTVNCEPPPQAAPLFQVVRPYDSTQIDKAFSDLLVQNERRLCFILPQRQTFEHLREGPKLRVAKVPQFALLITDTDRRTGQQALFGGPDNPGTITLADIVTDALTGQTLGIPGVVISPLEGDDITVHDERKPQDPGRKGWLLLLETPAGTRHVPLPR